MTNSEPILAQIIGAGIVVGLPWFLIVTGIQRLRKKYLYGWRYFTLGAIAAIFLAGWVGLYTMTPSDPPLVGLFGIVIFPLAISVAITELAYAAAGQGAARSSGESGDTKVAPAQAASGSTDLDRYLIWPKGRIGWRAPSLWVSVYDDDNSLLLQSKRIKHKSRDFKSFFEEGVVLCDRCGDEQEKLRIEYPSLNTSQTALCDVVDCASDERVGSLHHLAATEEIAEETGTALLSMSWQFATPAGDIVGAFHPSQKLMGPRYDYEINVNDKPIGRIYLRGKNRLVARPLIAEFEPDSAPQLDRRIVFSFASLIFAIDTINHRPVGIGGGG